MYNARHRYLNIADNHKVINKDLRLLLYKHIIRVHLDCSLFR